MYSLHKHGLTGVQETLVGYENMLKSRRQELQDLRNQAEAAKKRDDIYARIETSLLRMYGRSALCILAINVFISVDFIFNTLVCY